MTTSREYLQYAQECWRAATEVKSEKDREDLLEMAKAWNQLALSEAPASSQGSERRTTRVSVR